MVSWCRSKIPICRCIQAIHEFRRGSQPSRFLARELLAMRFMGPRHVRMQLYLCIVLRVLLVHRIDHSRTLQVARVSAASVICRQMKNAAMQIDLVITRFFQPTAGSRLIASMSTDTERWIKSRESTTRQFPLQRNRMPSSPARGPSVMRTRRPAVR